MTDLEQASKDLAELLAKHSAVLAFQKAEAKVKALPDLQDEVISMKAYQQEAVLYQKLAKSKAASQAETKADSLNQALEQEPVVQDYRAKMQDASDLLQYVTNRLEERINEELGNGEC